LDWFNDRNTRLQPCSYYQKAEDDEDETEVEAGLRRWSIHNAIREKAIRLDEVSSRYFLRD
jgi:hypothetical protein